MQKSFIYSGIIALLVLALIITAYLFGKNAKMSSSSTIMVDVSRENVVKQVESLNRLETASFTIEKVIEAGTQGNQFQEILYGDRILLIANAKVVAGIDMSSISTANVSVSGTSVSATLPAPYIFSTTLDNTQTKVFDRKLGLLSRGNQNLESQARAGAETAITTAACTGGILDEANTNAKSRLTELFSGLGFTSITITTTAGSCN